MTDQNKNRENKTKQPMATSNEREPLALVRDYIQLQGTEPHFGSKTLADLMNFGEVKLEGNALAKFLTLKERLENESFDVRASQADIDAIDMEISKYKEKKNVQELIKKKKEMIKKIKEELPRQSNVREEFIHFCRTRDVDNTFDIEKFKKGADYEELLNFIANAESFQVLREQLAIRSMRDPKKKAYVFRLYETQAAQGSSEEEIIKQTSRAKCIHVGFYHGARSFYHCDCTRDNANNYTLSRPSTIAEEHGLLIVYDYTWFGNKEYELGIVKFFRAFSGSHLVKELWAEEAAEIAAREAKRKEEVAAIEKAQAEHVRKIEEEQAKHQALRARVKDQLENQTLELWKSKKFQKPRPNAPICWRWVQNFECDQNLCTCYHPIPGKLKMCARSARRAGNMRLIPDEPNCCSVSSEGWLVFRHVGDNVWRVKNNKPLIGVLGIGEAEYLFQFMTSDYITNVLGVK